MLPKQKNYNVGIYLRLSKEFDNIGAGDPYRTMVYKQQLRVGAVLNEMLKEYREMINGNSSNFE